MPLLSTLATWSANNTELKPTATGVNLVIAEVNGIRAGTSGHKRAVKAAVTVLTEDDSGALCIWNTAAGYLYTLPEAVAGIWFDFVVQTTITSVGAKVITASGDFIVGTFMQGTDTTYLPAFRDADGTTHVSWNGNGSTTGGLKGDFFRLTAISGTQWIIEGTGSANGSEASPFATS